MLNTEVIIVDFNTGDYYVLGHLGKQIWQCFEYQLSYDQIVEMLSKQYPHDIARIEIDLQQLLDQLLAKNLIALTQTEVAIPLPMIVFHEKEYTAPILRTYTDVQNLLLLDPIHEVTGAGWPHALS